MRNLDFIGLDPCLCLPLLLPRFFADLNSKSYPPAFWHTMRTFYDGDTYPALGLYFKFFDVAVSPPTLAFLTFVCNHWLTSDTSSSLCLEASRSCSLRRDRRSSSSLVGSTTTGSPPELHSIPWTSDSAFNTILDRMFHYHSFSWPPSSASSSRWFVSKSMFSICDCISTSFPSYLVKFARLSPLLSSSSSVTSSRLRSSPPSGNIRVQYFLK